MNPSYTPAAAIACIFALATMSWTNAQETYSDVFDQVDLSALLADATRVDSYVKCFLAAEDDDCDQMGRQVKVALTEAMASDCAKCTQRQRSALARTVGFLRKERPADWERLQAKFDPSGAYANAHPELFQ